MFAIALFLTVTLISPLSTTRADELPSIPVTPASTKVLILPSLDETGDRADMQQEHVLVATMFFSRCNNITDGFDLLQLNSSLILDSLRTFPKQLDIGADASPIVGREV
jgi:hypothetical protein